MKIIVCSDELGVLDKVQSCDYIFVRLLFTSEEDGENYSRLYVVAEQNIDKTELIVADSEVKAFGIKPK